MKKYKEKGWTIKGIYGFYTGWYFTRRNAIESHCERIGRDWEYCKLKRDKAVKIEITERN